MSTTPPFINWQQPTIQRRVTSSGGGAAPQPSGSLTVRPGGVVPRLGPEFRMPTAAPGMPKLQAPPIGLDKRMPGAGFDWSSGGRVPYGGGTPGRATAPNGGVAPPPPGGMDWRMPGGGFETRGGGAPGFDIGFDRGSSGSPSYGVSTSDPNWNRDWRMPGAGFETRSGGGAGSPPVPGGAGTADGPVYGTSHDDPNWNRDWRMPGAAPTGVQRVTGTGGGAAPPAGGTDWGMPGAPSSPGSAPMTADPFGPTSAMDVYRASAPVMQREMQDRISEGMARAGFGGNRFGSYAMKTAAEEGSRAGLDQNALMANLLYGQTNRDADRSLTANDQAMRWTQLEDEMARNRITLPFQLSQWEQGRQDMFSNQQFQDWSNNRMGWLPYLGSMAQSPGTAATPGQYGAQQTAGSPSFLDYASAFAPYFMAFYGNRRG